MVAITLFATTTSDLFAMSAKVMGGFKSMTSNGPDKAISVKCGTDVHKVCYKKMGNGDVVVGQPVRIWVCTDPNDEFNGIGYIDAIFQGYFEPNVPESGLILEKTSETIETTDYNYWENYISN